MAEILDRNVEEARSYIDAAYRDAEGDRALAAWERDMAAAHLKFNEAGHALAVAEIQRQAAAHQGDDRVPGMMDIWEDRHGRMLEESNAVRYLIERWS